MEDNLNQPEEILKQTGDLQQILPPNSKHEIFAAFEKENKSEEQESQNIEFSSSISFASTCGTFCSIQEETTTTSEPTEKKAYRLHFGTQPGPYTRRDLTFIKSQQNHSQMIPEVKIFIDNLKVKHEFIEQHTFSYSSWGLEPYTCCTLHDTKESVMGIAALIGSALRQDAIGVYADHYSPHRVFTVKSKDLSPFKGQKALQLMSIIIKSHEKLCGQFNETGEYLEFHDFENVTSGTTTIQDLKNTIKRYKGTHELFEIRESVSRSDLLEKENYENAIKAANLEGFIAMINLTRSSDRIYNNKELI